MNGDEYGAPELPDIRELPSPRELTRRLDRLDAEAAARHAGRLAAGEALARVRAFLDLAPATEALLEKLAQELFGELLSEIEQTLTQAIRGILGQERVVRARRESRAGRLHVQFEIEQGGCVEDVLTGQGGSVCNILSVGLRLITLAQLDPARHRPFLVLDEQDCWLKPELVPQLVAVIQAVAAKLGLQVLIISHHSLDRFSFKADRIYGLSPSREHGVELRLLKGAGEESGGEGGEAAPEYDPASVPSLE
ncbi:hypothetical protein dsx2_1021 [Desulfovibrio sp. X2]|uniref:hypothetical protein n=1 Tax=Desulfovibrio sp. X2 TaxID=941449 RepID=UPI00035888CE|nr:hypothetical protein [Desulfovibrio sp. X2]EPR37078.1 hypothetical protein dsx2_1021 [Desulfovibrio sp. X2]